MIIGIVLGVIVLVGGVAVFLCIKRQRRKQREARELRMDKRIQDEQDR